MKKKIKYNLSDLISSSSKKLTGNFADYETCKPYVCCGWMDVHDDSYAGATEENPYFVIIPVYWNSRAVLLVTDDDGWIVTIPRTINDQVVFNARKKHGLYPSNLAKKILENQSWELPEVKKFNKSLGYEDPIHTPKLVWTFIDSSDNSEGHNVVIKKYT